MSARLQSHPSTDREHVRQVRLVRLNQRRLTPALPAPGWREELVRNAALLAEEVEFLEDERRAVSTRAAQAPSDAEGFLAWFEDLKRTGPGQDDPLFPWLATRASRLEMAWYLTQEVAGEAGFEDLTALAQVKMPTGPKLEMARNYWDEMGRGGPKGMHGPMLATLARALDLRPSPEDTVWESLALGNVMTGLAAHRRYAYHAIGALGVVELTAPGRSACVARGLKRLGVPPGERHYFDLHASLDIRHSEAWNREVIGPLVRENPAVAPAIAEGALMRLTCGARCFSRYRQEFGL